MNDHKDIEMLTKDHVMNRMRIPANVGDRVRTDGGQTGTITAIERDVTNIHCPEPFTVYRVKCDTPGREYSGLRVGFDVID
jgi:hypothetical protein